MSIVKSFSVGDGDMFYIKHGSDNFSVIDCFMNEENQEDIVNEIINESNGKGIKRFISTHPDEDHIQGIKYLNENWPIYNFYCVKNEAKKDDVTESFEEYCNLRDGDKAFYVKKGCSRKWMNISDDERGSAGISFLWPNTDNEEFKKVLESVKEGGSPNNLSPIFRYSCGAKFMWMGDIESDFLTNVSDEIVFPEVDVLFAPHHGRGSGKVPKEILEILKPQIIVIGEAPSEYLDYYNGYNTITQNSAGDIIFDVDDKNVDVYVGKSNYSVDYLTDNKRAKFSNYIGSFEARS